MNRKAIQSRYAVCGATALALLSLASCSTVKGIFAADTAKDANKPISNPFAGYTPGATEDPTQSMIFRTRQGDKSVEVEIPRANQGVTDFVIPAPGGASASRGLASTTEPQQFDESYSTQKPTQTDRELTRGFATAPIADEQERTEIEKGLGLVQSDEMTPERQKSYLASLDHVKQLYRGGRYEAGLIEVDSLIRDYPTDPKLHEMRGTLLDRLGHRDLAIRSWNQALRFDPQNESLKKFIGRRSNRVPAAQKTEATP